MLEIVHFYMFLILIILVSTSGLTSPPPPPPPVVADLNFEGGEFHDSGRGTDHIMIIIMKSEYYFHTPWQILKVEPYTIHR